jgi:hypothetical protein
VVVKLIVPSAIIAVGSYLGGKMIFSEFDLGLFSALFLKGGGFVLIYTALFFIWSSLHKFKNKEIEVIIDFYRIVSNFRK